MNISLPDYIWLRKGRPRTVTVVGQAPRVGRAYVATPPKDSGKPKMHVTVLAVESDGEGWSVTVTPHDIVDHPRLLRARPGAGGDYTTEPRLAAEGEPEAVPAAFQAGISAGASDRDHELRAALRDLGFERHTVNYRTHETDSGQSTASYYRLPLAILETS